MAAISNPEPGSQYGPCDGECKHIDCSATRADARRSCTVCMYPIGYNRMWWMVEDQPMHRECTPELVR